MDSEAREMKCGASEGASEAFEPRVWERGWERVWEKNKHTCLRHTRDNASASVQLYKTRADVAATRAGASSGSADWEAADASISSTSGVVDGRIGPRGQARSAGRSLEIRCGPAN